MKKSKVKTTTYTFADVDVVDELGELTAKVKKMTERIELLKETLKSYGPGVYDGKVYTALSSERVRTSYKSELLRENVDEDTLKKCEVITPYLALTFEKRTKLRVVK